MEVYRKGPEQLISFLATVLGLVFTDLLTGIGIGLAVSLVAILWNNYRTPFCPNTPANHPEDGLHINFAEEVSFLNKAGVCRFFEQLPNDISVVLDARKTREMHPDIREIIDDFIVNSTEKNISVTFIPPCPPKTTSLQTELTAMAQEKARKARADKSMTTAGGVS